MLTMIVVGMKVYDLMAGFNRTNSSYFMTKSSAMAAFPMLQEDRLKCAVIYHDGQCDVPLRAATSTTAPNTQWRNTARSMDD